MLVSSAPQWLGEAERPAEHVAHDGRVHVHDDQHLLTGMGGQPNHLDGVPTAPGEHQVCLAIAAAWLCPQVPDSIAGRSGEKLLAPFAPSLAPKAQIPFLFFWSAQCLQSRLNLRRCLTGFSFMPRCVVRGCEAQRWLARHD